jgi:hypothetical protein
VDTGRVPTSRHPQRTILRRWREGAVTLGLLECDHTEPITGLDLATSVRCQQCNPVRRPDAPNLTEIDPFRAPRRGASP